MMLKFVLSRLAMAFLTIFVAAVLTFIIVHLMPGTPGEMALGTSGDDESIRAFNENIGWFDPWPVQFMDWVGMLFSGSLGYSYIDNRDLSIEIITRIQVTSFLAIGAIVFTAILGVVTGVTAAVRGGRVDRVLNSIIAFFIAVPAFWFAIFLILVFAVLNPILPASGYVDIQEDPIGWASSLILPVTALAVMGGASVARITRAAMLDAISQEHIRTLRSIGMPTTRIIYLHALRFASIQIVSVIGLNFVLIFGGTITVEMLFQLPGLGTGMQRAIGMHDVPQIQAVVLVTTIVVVITMFITEIVTSLLNPKVRTR
jgi:peptide/nickel transport system permease protein